MSESPAEAHKKMWEKLTKEERRAENDRAREYYSHRGTI